MIGAAAQTALRRRGVPRVIVAAIAVAWAVAIAAEITGTAQLVHHDALAHSDLPLIAVLGIFVIAWQLMIVAMMLPSSLPLIRLFRVAAANQPSPGRATMGLLLGYAAVWTAFGVVAFLGDLGCPSARARMGMARGASPGHRRVRARAGWGIPVLEPQGTLSARVPLSWPVPSPALRARSRSRLPARQGRWALLPRVLLGVDARRVRRWSGQPLVDGDADGADGVREDRSRRRTWRDPHRSWPHRPGVVTLVAPAAALLGTS